MGEGDEAERKPGPDPRASESDGSHGRILRRGAACWDRHFQRVLLAAVLRTDRWKCGGWAEKGEKPRGQLGSSWNKPRREEGGWTKVGAQRR